MQENDRLSSTKMYEAGVIICDPPEVSPEERVKTYFEVEAVSSSALKAAYPGVYQAEKPEYNYKAALLGNLTEMLACFPAHANALYTTADLDMSNHMAQLIESAINQGITSPDDRDPSWWLQEKERLSLLGSIKKEDTLISKIRENLEIFGILMDSRVPVKSADYVLASTMANVLANYMDELRKYYKSMWNSSKLPEMYFQAAAHCHVTKVGMFELNRPGKALIDILIMDEEKKQAAIIDVKTTSRLLPEFLYDISKYRYDIQASWYQTVLQGILGPEYSIEFAFLPISKSSPTVPTLFRMSDRMMASFFAGYKSPSGNTFPGLYDYVYNYLNPITESDASAPKIISDLWNPSFLYSQRTEQPSTGTLFS